VSLLQHGYVDLQVNGYKGIDFNDPDTGPAQILSAAEAMIADGVTTAMPTVITGSLEAMCRCITNLRAAIENNASIASIFCGIHLEGPFLSPMPGYIGAHPVQHARACDTQALEQLLDCSGHWVKLVTLAPEVDVHAELTKICRDRKIIVAAGHTDASLGQLEKCVDAGLSLFTHLGNGCPRLMDRHDNIIYRALRLRDRLRYSLIADGFHIPQLLFEHLLDWIPLDNLLVVSDAISAAGLGPGVYQLGGRQVNIGPDKAARDASGEHFVGAASSMRDADQWLTETLRLNLQDRRRLLVENPLRVLHSV
jgi:N-acetylglucosamine-6-phosphate deacetylase